MAFRVENNTVVNVYAPGKTAKMLRERLPDADIRKGDAVCGQIEIDGKFVDPPESRIQVLEREEEKRQRNIRRKLLNDLDSEDSSIAHAAIKKLTRYQFREDLK